MPIHPALHIGGPVNPPGLLVNDDGTQIIVPAYDNRRYLLVVAALGNADTIFLRLHLSESAIFGAGIPLPPGSWFEITYYNMYYGPIRAVTDTGKSASVYWQEGV
jgi:hypothetical protein